MSWYFRDGTPYRGGGKMKMLASDRAKVELEPVDRRGRAKGRTVEHRLYTARKLNSMWKKVEAGLRVTEVEPDGLKKLASSTGKSYHTYDKIPRKLLSMAAQPHFVWSIFEAGPKGAIRRIKDIE